MVPAAGGLPEGPLCDPKEPTGERRQAGHRGPDGADLQPSLCGGGQEGSKEDEEERSGGESVKHRAET